MKLAAPTLNIQTFRTLTDASAKELPTRLLVAKWGTTESRRGPVKVNDVTAAQLPGNQAANKFDRVALDWNHNTLDKSVPEPKTVAGYGTPRVVPGEGIWLEQMDYTPEGRALLPGGHYPDVSPAVERLPDGTVIFLHSAGAVRQGELDGLVFPFSALESTQQKPMQSPELTALIALLAAIGMEALPENPTPEQITAAATAAQTKLKEMKPAAAAPEMEKEISVEGFAAVAKRLDRMEAENAKSRIDSLLSAATAQGKVVPFSVAVAYRFTPEELTAELDKLPAGKVPGVGTPSHDIEAFGADANADAQGLEIFSALGLSQADYKEATKKQA